MVNKEYQLAVIIGRFQPLHNGHLALFKQAFEVADRVLILLGSSDQPRTTLDPWSYGERKAMIYNSIVQDDILKDMYRPRSGPLGLNSSNLEIDPLHDHISNTDWLLEVQDVVSSYIEFEYPALEIDSIKTCIIGCQKAGDDTTFYLEMFPQWDNIMIEEVLEGELSSSQIREFTYKNLIATYSEAHEDLDVYERALKFCNNFDIGNFTPEAVRSVINSMDYRDDYFARVEEYKAIIEYEHQWGKGPFTTVDGAIFCLGHVLIVKRKFMPGKGLWAMPGGFLNPDEYIASGIVRETKEETHIKVPVPVLHGNMKEIEVFQNPRRSQFGRRISHTGLINLRNEKELPEVRADDDAEDAKWVTISDFVDNYRIMMFEDHYQILIHMKSLMR